MFAGTTYACRIPLGGGNRVDIEYTDALWYFAYDYTNEAYARFSAVAGVSNAVRDASSARCQHDIDVARIFANALNPISAAGNNNEGISDEGAMLKPFKVWPNPASESVRLSFGHPVFTVYVYDVLGKLYYNKQVEDGSSVSVESWPSGLYWITAIDEVTKERSTVKLVVD